MISLSRLVLITFFLSFFLSKVSSNLVILSLTIIFVCLLFPTVIWPKEVSSSSPYLLL